MACKKSFEMVQNCEENAEIGMTLGQAIKDVWADEAMQRVRASVLSCVAAKTFSWACLADVGIIGDEFSILNSHRALLASTIMWCYVIVHRSHSDAFS